MKKLRETVAFTLAELLIVIAIIAVLVAIAIPVFSAELNKARLAVDSSNERLMKSYAGALNMSSSITVNGSVITIPQPGATGGTKEDLFIFYMEDGSLEQVGSVAGGLGYLVPERFPEGALRALGQTSGPQDQFGGIQHSKDAYLVMWVSFGNDVTATLNRSIVTGWWPAPEEA